MCSSKSKVEADVLPALDKLLDDLPEVNAGVVQNLGSIFSCLSHNNRDRYIDKLDDIRIQCSSSTWRTRLALAAQMIEFSRIFSIKSTCKSLVPLWFHLLDDDVEEVRSVTALSVFAIISRIKSAPGSCFADTVQKIVNRSTASRYDVRQQFAIVCDKIFSAVLEGESIEEYRDLVELRLLPPLLALHADMVSNVRLTLATVLSKHGLHSFANVSQASRKVAIG